MGTTVTSLSGKILPEQAQKITTSLTDESTKDVHIHANPKIIAFFIGGAGDKRPFIGSGPNNNIVDVINQFLKDFKSEINDGDVNANPEKNYLGFYEIFGDDKIASNVISQIHSKDIAIFIIGHSLGGWNGAHLSHILSTEGYLVDLLVTLDPVGIYYHTTLSGADIYPAIPRPIARYWVNLRYDGKTGPSVPNIVASAGGRWDVTESLPDRDEVSHPLTQAQTQRLPDINATVAINHADTLQAMYAKLAGDSCAWWIMKSRIGDILHSQHE
ncbi:hypothetical protein [Paraburkholderia bannensis]|uniref:hypothetical protein n=1 Tax=Paraburkholderia bannensis TaxID=765414 RepID=UPI002AB6A740|nr:hypothetical protein [Paraburkholderia bannensis]